MTGVSVWLRTNSRSCGVNASSGRTDSQRISALVSWWTKRSSGRGLRIVAASASLRGRDVVLIQAT